MTSPTEESLTLDDEQRLEVAALKVGSYFTSGKDLAHQMVPDEGADERLVKFARSFVRAAHAHGIPAMCTEIYRGKERQNQLKAAGKSKAAWGQSAHNYGKACDIVHGTKAWDMTNRQWRLFGTIGKEIARRQNVKMTWGGDWSFYDPAHWELTGWKAEK